MPKTPPIERPALFSAPMVLDEYPQNGHGSERNVGENRHVRPLARSQSDDPSVANLFGHVEVLDRHWLWPETFEGA